MREEQRMGRQKKRYEKVMTEEREWEGWVEHKKEEVEKHVKKR